MQLQSETLDEVIERWAQASEMGAVTQLLAQRRLLIAESRPDQLTDDTTPVKGRGMDGQGYLASSEGALVALHKGR